MKPEDIVEVFAGAVIVTVMVFVVIQIINPAVGNFLFTLFPSIVNLFVFLLIIGLFGAIVYQILDSF